MAVYTWMQMARTQRQRARRSRGRRATDQLPSMESLLLAGGILAWSWCAYEVLRLAIR